MFNSEVHCCTCLSKDRTLTPTNYSLFTEFSTVEIENTSHGICWECHSLLMKFNKFKLQVQRAHTIMHQKVSQIQSLSKLSHQYKNTYDFIFIDNFDLSIHTEIQLDTNYVKEEQEFHIEDINEVKDNIHIHVDEDMESAIKLNYTNNDNESDVRVNAIKMETDDGNLDFEIENSAKEISKIDNMIKTDEIEIDNGNQEYEIEDGAKEVNKIYNVIESDESVNEGGDAVDIANVVIKKEVIEANIKGVSKKKLINKENNVINNSNLNTKNLINNMKVKKAKINEIPEEDIKEKYDSFVLTEEEMIRVREEKKNHPNFKKVPYKCDSCVLGFLKKENYDLHLVKKHDEKIGQYACAVCLVRFPKLTLAERHMNKHYTVFKCKLCKYETCELWSANYHCKSRHSGDTAGSIHCPKCVSIFKTREELVEHTNKHHMLSCSECSMQFKGGSSLRSHRQRVHAVKRNFVCEYCRRCFKSQYRLESHMIRHEGSLAKKLTYCSQCEVQYKNLQSYRHHLKNSMNHSQDVFTCSECGKRFASKFSCKKHYECQHMHKSVKCSLCNKAFASEWKLRRHRQKQHGMAKSRDHACTVCGKKFYTRTTLGIHLLIHSEERTYMCEDCGDTFKQKAALYTHVRLVHKGGRKGKATNTK